MKRLQIVLVAGLLIGFTCAAASLAYGPLQTPKAQIASTQLVSDRKSQNTASFAEGVWAKTNAECLDDEGPNSRTVIALNDMVGGKPTPMFDQYENHCLIESKNISGNDVTLSVTCYEFWENFSKRIEGTKLKIKLSRSRRNGLSINGEAFQRCSSKPVRAQ